MSEVKLRINGIDVETEQGNTILEAAQGLGIFIPTLCHHEALIPRGACRMCIVEDKGRLKAACTMPAENGMDIITDSPRIQHIRETTIQMIFTSRNHYCMYCEVSGDCELQDLGYKLGMDHFNFATYENRYPVDTSHPYIIFEHNRCILCGRCVRACTDLTGHYVLTERSRGVKTLIVADIESPLGRSSCVSCGACVQVCPTGALIEKRAAYQRNREKNEQIKAVCDMCPVGCGIEIHKNPGTNSVIKIHGDWHAGPTNGLLCKNGRYLSLYEEHQVISSPRMRRGTSMKEIKAGELEGVIKEKIDSGAAYVDGSLSNEELSQIKDLFGEKVYSLRPVNAPIPSTARIEDLNTAGTIVVFRLDLDAQYGALGSLIKRRVATNEASLILVDAPENTFSKLPRKRLGSSEFLADIKGLTGTNDCLLVYQDLEDKERDVLSSQQGMKFLWLPPETNTFGLAKLGIEHAAPKGKALFFFGKDIPEVAIEDGTYVACFSPHENRLTRRADLVVPIRDGFEREGTFYNLEGEIVKRVRVLSPGPDRIDLKELLVRMLPKG